MYVLNFLYTYPYKVTFYARCKIHFEASLFMIGYIINIKLKKYPPKNTQAHLGTLFSFSWSMYCFEVYIYSKSKNFLQCTEKKILAIQTLAKKTNSANVYLSFTTTCKWLVNATFVLNIISHNNVIGRA